MPQRSAFAAFPRLEIARADQRQRLLGFSGLLVKRAEFHAQIVALLYKVTPTLQFAQPTGGSFAEPFPKLVAFVEQARVGRVCLERPVVSGASLSRLLADVKVADAEIAPDDKEVWIQPGATFPELNRLIMPPPVIEQVAQIIGSASVAGIGAHRGFEDGDLFESRGEAIVRR